MEGEGTPITPSDPDWADAADRFTELAAAIDRYAYVAADLIAVDHEPEKRVRVQRVLAEELWCSTIDVAHWYERRLQEQE